MSQAGLDPPSHETRHFPAPTLTHLWLGLPFFIILLKGFLFPLPLLDFWWHLRMGQVILDTLSIPRVDLFSFTAAGKLFVVQNWLAEIVLYLVYKAGGIALLVFFNTLMLLATLVPVYDLCRRSSERLWPGIVSASLVSICMVCNLRPQVFSFLLFSIYYWLLSGYCSRKRNWLWLLPVLMVLWVNLHGAFVLGLLLVLIHFAGEMIASFAGSSGEDCLTGRQLGKLALAFIFCAGATLANPEIHRVYSYILTVMRDPSSQQFVIEWQPPAVTSIQGFFLFYLPFFLATLVLILTDRRPRLTDLLLYIGFSVFGLTASRNSVWFLLAVAPIIARYMPYVSVTSGSAPWRRGSVLSPGSAQPDSSTKRQSPLLNVAIAAAALVLVTIQSPWIQHRFFNASLLDSKTPVKAMDYLEKHSLQGHIFHPQIYGDYLIWRLWPRQRSFFDGRVHLFGESLVKFYQRVYTDSHWEDLLKEQDIRYLLLCKQEEKPDSNRMIASARSSHQWIVLYEDDQAILFENVSGNQSSAGDPSLPHWERAFLLSPLVEYLGDVK